jgi:hypothetical protein
VDLCGIKLKMSTSRHHQTDGSSEIMNRMIENYLKCYCCYRQKDWDELLPYAEFAYISAVSEDLGMSPFEIDLGWVPKSPLELFSASPSRVQGVEDFKTELQLFYTMLSFFVQSCSRQTSCVFIYAISSTPV